MKCPVVPPGLMVLRAPSPKEEAGGLSRCYGKVPKEGSDWPGLDPVPILEPIAMAGGVKGRDWPALPPPAPPPPAGCPSCSQEEGEGKDAGQTKSLEAPPDGAL